MNDYIYVNGRFLNQKLSGVQRVGLEVGVHLQTYYKDKLVFLCPRSKSQNSLNSELNCKRIGYFDGYFWEQIELPIYLYIKNASVLLNFCNTAPILFNKNIVVIHDMAVKFNKKWFDWKFVYAYKVLFFFNSIKAKLIITDSYFSKSEIIKYYPKINQSKIHVVYLASFIKSKKKEDFNLKYFLAINSINPRKNIDVITKAFKSLNPQKYFLKIVGETNKKVFGEEYIQSTSNIEYLHNISDYQLIDLINKSRAVINSSFYEGFGLPPLEAMSLGTPCILSNIDVHTELYEGVALFFEPNNFLELSEKVKFITKANNYHEFCLKSFEKSKEFSWTKTSNEYINLINIFLKA